MKRIAALIVMLSAGLAAGATYGATDWSAEDYDLYPADFDGDGRTDVLYIAKDAAKASGIARSDGSGPNIPFQSWPSSFLGIPWHSNVYTVVVADFNGDGKSDLFLQRTTPGDHFLLLTGTNGKVTGISQTVGNSAFGLLWSGDQHEIHAGDFSGDGKADLFLQATTPSGTHAVIRADDGGTFTAGPQQWWTDGDWGSFKWSSRNSIMFVGDFNGDGRADLLLQAKPTFVSVGLDDISIPVPTYPPNSNGIVLSQGGSTPFAQIGVQQWGRQAHGVDWASLTSNIVVGDFDGNGRADVLLQGRRANPANYLLSGNASGAAFASGISLASNVTWNGNSYRLIAGNFDGLGGEGIFQQALTRAGTNQYANTVTGSSVSFTPHNAVAASGVVAATAVGHTVGEFSVSNTGAATYSIPVVVPPGVAGLQPGLSLNYASGAGNGPLGMGWSLGGFSEISRCSKTLAQDNSNDAVLLTTADRFCLDGNKLRLTGGSYGVAGSTYQPEMETFSKVTAVGAAGNGPASFVVEGKNGWIYEYGNTADSRIESLNPAASTTPRTWAVNKVTDRHGNYMTFAYQKDGAPNGSYRPATITYTSNASAGLVAAYRVNLHWDPRPASDKIMMYLAGGIVRETQRLNRIETQYNDPNAGGWRLVRRYQLSYNSSGVSGRSRLAAVQECDRAGACLAPTTVSWQEGTFGWAPTTVASVSVPSTAVGRMPVDLNGDSRTDYVFYDTSNKYWRVMFANGDGTYQSPVNIYSGSSTVQTPAIPADVNGDGKQDLLIARQSDQTWVWVSHGGGTTFNWQATGLSSTGPGNRGVFPTDVNGDGLVDIVSASNTSVYVALNQSTSTFAAFGAATAAWTAQQYTDVYGDPFNWNTNFTNSEVQSADFDGDSRGDVLLLVRENLCGMEPTCPPSYVYRWLMLRSTGTGYAQSNIVSSYTTIPSNPLLADLNGDGLTDLVYESISGTSRIWSYRLSTSGALGAEVSTGYSGTGLGSITDCDLDGYSDLAISQPNGTSVCLRSDGTGLTGTPIPIPANGLAMVADANGDALLDFVGPNLNGVMQTRLHNGVLPDFVASIADGFGNSVSVTYAPLTDSSIYTRGSGAVFPQVDFQGGLYVVKKYTASDGVGGTYTTSETYGQARLHVRGRGFLGFALRSSTDSRTGIRTSSTIRQDHPYVGFVDSVTTYQPNGSTPISHLTITPDEVVTEGTAFNDRRFAYARQTIQKTYQVGGTTNGQPITQTTATTTLDVYGNPTNITTTVVDMTGSSQSYTTSTTQTYDPADTTCRLRGFVKKREVTNTVPGFAAQTRTVEYIKDTGNPAACRVYQEIIEPNDTTGELKLTTTLGYDAFGNSNSQQIAGANIPTRTVNTGFGSRGVFPETLTRSVSASFNEVASTTYDFALGLPKTTTDANGLVVVKEYDGFGRLTQELRPDGTRALFIYSACSVANNYCGDARLRYQIERRDLDANGGIIRSSRELFDALSRALYTQTQTISGAYTNVAANYDGLGRPYQHSQPYFSGFPAHFTTVTYDLLGRPVQEDRRISDSDSGTRTVKYDYDRLTSTITDPNNGQTSKRVNAIGQIVQVTDAANGITQYQYDPFGNLRKTIDPQNNEIVNEFDLRGFKRSTADPNMGTWIYTYYPTGELWTQRDAKNQLVTFTYDLAGRPLTRAEPEGTTTFTYGTSAALKNIGQIESVTAPGAYSQSYAYDTLARLKDVTTNADGTSFVVSNSYDATTGLIDTVTYPTSTSAVPGSRFKVRYEHEYGSLKRVRDFNAPSTIYWEQIASNAAGQAIDEQLGNGLHTYSTYDSLSGLLSARTAGSTAQVQNLTYQWDKAGNLKQRKDHNQSVSGVGALTEDFYYDGLNRLDYSRLNGVTTPNLDMSYDSLGNIQSKTEGGGSNAYNYSAQQAGCSYYSHAQPNAVRRVGTSVYCYDQNGNMTRRAGSDITWYSYNLPNRINNGSNFSQFYYGADRARYKQVAFTAAGGSLPAGTETTIYVGGLYERVTKPSGVVEHKHYILANADAIAVRTLRSNAAHDTRYLHKDHLGSVDTITNESGQAVLRLAYDAFGKRRNAVGWSGVLPLSDWSSLAALTHRGFTQHEHLDNVDVIHMNGRVYDPNIARFISADPFIQAPLLSQSLNRYSYVMNNPLSLVDPSGYS